MEKFSNILNESNDKVKFTFKTEKPTGRYKSFSSNYNYIKLNGSNVGSIDDEKPYKIRLMVYKKDMKEDGNPNCDWKWIILKVGFDNLDDAKNFVLSNATKIVSQFNLKCEKDDEKDE